MKYINILSPFSKFISAVILLFSAASCSTKYKVWVGEKKEQKIFNLPYGDGKRQIMDVFLPSTYSTTEPAVVIIHGGAWTRGNKKRMIMIQKYLFKNNIPTININYRLVRKGITYKDQMNDIGSAIKKFNTFSEKTGLTSGEYILLGESSGGHIALLYGYSHPESIKKIISLSGPTDFYSENYLQSFYSRYTSPTFQKVVGFKFDRESLSQDFKEASPIYKVSNVPTLLFQGDTDFLVNKKQGFALDSVLTAKNIEHKFIFMKNTGHTPRFFSKYKREKIILPEILQFIEK